MKLMVVGDTHGGTKNIIPKLNIARDLKINHVMVVGDFGLWDHQHAGHLFLDRVNAAAEANGLSVFALPGNHENHDHWNWYVENMPTATGFAYVRSNVLLAPKAHNWSWAGKHFAIAGGAVSIDREYRRALERGNREELARYGVVPQGRPGAGAYWWPNEQITDEEVQKVIGFEKVDYLFTHDCSNYTPWDSSLVADAESELHRAKIDRVIAGTKPTLHFHGHMHDKYQWKNYQSHGYHPNAFENVPQDAIYTQTYGLECNTDDYSWGVLDIEKGEFQWGIDMLDKMMIYSYYTSYKD